MEKELIELVRIPNVKGPRARLLYKAGFESVASLATASPDELCKIIRKDRPFVKSTNDPSLDEENNSVHNMIEMRVAISIIAAAKEVLESDRKELERAIRNILNPRRASAGAPK